ncbi:exosortase/archaeosortase family protein, partial [Bacteroidota bacterium]
MTLRKSSLIKKFNNFVSRHKLESFRDVGLFIIIILFMHIIWKVWQYKFGFRLFGVDVISSANIFLTDQVRLQSAWVLNHILGIETVIKGEYFHFSEYSRMGVTFGCSGLKQFYQFIGIILFFYGPWKKKLWFIPLGLLAIHIVNLFRIIFLSIIVIHKLEWFD